MFDVQTAFLAGLTLATSLLFVLLTRAVVYDVILTFFSTLSLYAFYCASEEGEKKRRRRFLFLFYCAMALAVLTKGPLGIVLPGLVIGPYILVTRQWRLLKSMELHWGALIVLALVLPWYVLMGQRNPEFLSHFFLEQNVGYLASRRSRYPQPVYYYVPVLLVGLFPWSPLLPQALAQGWRGFRRRESRELLFLLLWSVVVFAFFTAAVSKLPPYVLPVFPALALLLARFWAQQLAEPARGSGKLTALAMSPFGALVSGALVYGFFRPPVGLTEKYGIAVPLVYAVFATMAVLLLFSTVLLWRRQFAASFAALATASTSLVLFFVIFVAPSVDPIRSTKGLAATMDELLPPEQRICFYKTLKDSTLFYTDRLAVVLETPKELQEYLEASPQKPCVVESKQLKSLGGLADRFQVEAREGNKLLVRLPSRSYRTTR
jgi:4-amino-4-deoxy-L-arabinose transferase-like glycosyltransferase